MLIRFFVENFLCFNDMVEFSLVAGKGKLLSHHVMRGKKKNDINVLRSAVIYGANASGKSNLIKSMEFAKNLILTGTQASDLIPLKRFKLDAKRVKEPSKFQFDIKCLDKIYSYGFELDTGCIYSEWLHQIIGKKYRPIFERRISDGDKASVKFGKIDYQNSKDKKFIEFVAQGTRPNQLFLTESVQRNVSYFKEVYDWFKNKLIFIFPESMVRGIEFNFIPGQERTNRELLKFFLAFDTGISGMTTKKCNLKDLTDIPEETKNRLQKDLQKNGDAALLCSLSDKERYTVIKDNDDELKALRLLTKHKLKNSQEEVIFDVNDESDGTQRLIDLLPALLMLLNSDSTIVIDEIDRSLHPFLTKKFLEIFLNESKDKTSQLVLTTHESSLLNFKLLRKDEIWFIERNKFGESSVYSLEEYKPRYDKDIQKGYLLGRFGAVPFIRDRKNLNI